MKLLKVLCVGVCLFILSGCSAVYLDEPIGEKAFHTLEDVWEGTWIHKEGSVTVRVIDAEKGLIEVSWVEKKPDSITLERYELAIRRTGNWLFGNLVDPDNSKRYLWGRVIVDSNQILVWIPNAEIFKALVNKGELPGSIDKDDNVLLTKLNDKHVRLITSGDMGVVVEWEQPIVFLRLTR